LNCDEWDVEVKVELRFEFMVLGRGIACMIPKSFVSIERLGRVFMNTGAVERLA
jgi:hypothetical protein